MGAQIEPQLAVLVAADIAHEREHNTFDQLLESVNSQQQALAALNQLFDNYRAQYLKKIAPLVQQQRALNQQLVEQLDLRLQGKGLSAHLRRSVADIIYAVASSSLQGLQEGAPQAQVFSQLRERHALPQYGADPLAAAMAQDAPSDPEDAYAAAMRSMHDAQQQRSDAKAAHKKSLHKKTIVSKDKNLCFAQAQSDAQKSMQAVYRKLVSVLHPDRESDAQARLRKTALLVQVNLAYEKKDLMALLQLQMQLQSESACGKPVPKPAKNTLRQFNLLLTAQVQGLQTQQAQAARAFCAEFGIAQPHAISSSFLQHALRRQLLEVNAHLAYLQQDIQTIQTDAALKRWVKLQVA